MQSLGAIAQASAGMVLPEEPIEMVFEVTQTSTFRRKVLITKDQLAKYNEGKSDLVDGIWYEVDGKGEWEYHTDVRPIAEHEDLYNEDNPCDVTEYLNFE